MMDETMKAEIERYRRLLEQRPHWTPDEAAQTAASEGKSVIPVIAIL